MCSFQETERYRTLQGHYFKKWVYGEDTSLRKPISYNDFAKHK